MTTPKTSARRRAAGPCAARRAAGTVGVLLALATALTGCGSDAGDHAKAPASSASSAPSRSAGASPASPTPTESSASPSPTAVKPMKPSTAAELRACADGSCTVVVKTGSVLPRADALRAGPFTVTDVSAEGVDLTSVDATGFNSSLLGQRPDQGGPSTVNELSIEVLALAGDTAKLQLYPAKD